MDCPRPLKGANSGSGAGLLKIRVVRPSVLDRNDRKDHNDHKGPQHAEQLSIILTGTAQARVVGLATGTSVARVRASGMDLSPGS
jgi:hypothetical protein